MSRPGVPAYVLAERLAFVLKSARLKAGEADPTPDIEEAQQLTDQLKEALR